MCAATLNIESLLDPIGRATSDPGILSAAQASHGGTEFSSDGFIGRDKSHLLDDAHWHRLRRGALHLPARRSRQSVNVIH